MSDDPATGDPSSDEPATDGAVPAGRAPIELQVLVLGAVLVGVALRFYARSPLWLDEALSVNIAKVPISEIPEALRHDGHPPLYYVLLHLWMGALGSSDAMVRALSGLISVLTLPFAFLAGRRAGGAVVGWLTLGVFALNPFVLRYATETRMYALVMLLVFVGYLLVDDLVRRGAGWSRVVALALVVAALLYSHYWSMWLLAATCAVLLVLARRAHATGVRRGAVRAAIGLVGGGVLFLPWVPVLLWQSKHTGTPWAGPVRPTSLVASTFTDFGGGGFKDAQFVGAVLFTLVLLGVFGRAVSHGRIDLELRTDPRHRVEAAVVAGTVLIGLAVSYASSSTFVTRYASVYVPLLVLLTAAGIACFTHRAVQAGVLAFVLLLFSLGCLYNITSDRTQAKVIAGAVAAQAAPGDLVVYCPDQLGPAALREMRTDLDQLGYPTLTSPERIDWVDYVARNAVPPDDYAAVIRDRAGDGHGIFVVWSGTYKTHKGTCDTFIEKLTERLGPRPAPRPLVSEDGDTYYEHANLLWFPPVTAGSG